MSCGWELIRETCDGVLCGSVCSLMLHRGLTKASFILVMKVKLTICSGVHVVSVVWEEMWCRSQNRAVVGDGGTGVP